MLYSKNTFFIKRSIHFEDFNIKGFEISIKLLMSLKGVADSETLLQKVIKISK